MKRIAAVFAGASLLAWGAQADDVKAEAKTEGHRNADGTGHVKTMKKHKRGGVTRTTTTDHKVSKNLGGGTTETKETVTKQDAPGAGNDAKVEMKETIKRDANGRVIKHEKKAESK